MKDNLSYYRHETGAHNHWKFKTLRREYFKKFGGDGWAGEGKFWALNNMIADAQNCKLDLGDLDKRRSIATDLDFSLEEFNEYLNCLIQICKLVLEVEGNIITIITQECFEEVSQKREYQRSWKREKSISIEDILNSKNEKSTIESKQSKTKEIKINEINILRQKKEKEFEELVNDPTRQDLIQLIDFVKNLERKLFSFQIAVMLWNAFVIGRNFPSVVISDPQLETHWNVSIRNPDFDFVKLLNKVSKSWNMAGDNSSGWKASFGFLINLKNFRKIMNGAIQ